MQLTGSQHGLASSLPATQNPVMALGSFHTAAACECVMYSPTGAASTSAQQETAACEDTASRYTALQQAAMPDFVQAFALLVSLDRQLFMWSPPAR